MACGLPVIASPVGVNTEIVEHGKNGYLASNIEEWVNALTCLRNDKALCSRLGMSGRKKVETDYFGGVI
ncbi:MAG: glycosyltransferase [Pseudomonadota bacterium]